MLLSLLPLEPGILTNFFMIIPNEKITLCLSEDVLNEYWRVSVYARIRKKYPDYTEKMNFLIEAIQEVGVLYFPSQKFTIIKDSSDNKFLDLAYEAKADYIMTGNKNDFSIHQFEQTKIVAPKEFFELYETRSL